MALLPLIELQGTYIKVGSVLWNLEDKNPIQISKVATAIFAYKSILRDTSSRKSTQCLRHHLLETSTTIARLAAKYLATAVTLKEWSQRISPEHQKTYDEFAEELLRFALDRDSLNLYPIPVNCALPWNLVDSPLTLTLKHTDRPMSPMLFKSHRLCNRVKHLVVDDLLFDNFSGRLAPIISQCLEPLYATLVELTLSDLGLEIIPPELKNFSSLQVLTLNANSITVIGNSLPPSLTLLSFFDNPLRAFTSDVHVSRVEMNFSRGIWPRGLPHLHAVETLYLEKIPERILHGDFAQLTSLNTLILENASPIEVSPLIGLSSLETLWMNHPDFTDVFTLTQLKVLCVDDFSHKSVESSDQQEKIPGIEDEFSSKSTQPSSEKKEPPPPLVTIPPMIGNMTNLKGLFFCYCCHITLPEEITRCTQLNLLSRLILRNKHETMRKNRTFFTKWLKGPFQKMSSLPNNPIAFNKRDKLFKLSTHPIHLTGATKKDLVEALVGKHTQIYGYETELSTTLENLFRCHLFIFIPPKLYHEYFMTYFLCYAESVENGESFQRYTLKKLFPFLKKNCAEFASDAHDEGAEFTEAFIQGKIWYDEATPQAGIDIKGAWRPKQENKSFAVPPSKKNRSAEIHYYAFT